MHITLFNFFKKPNPQYENMADGLRSLGYTVWLGSHNQDGNLQWHDGEQIVGLVPGPSGRLSFLSKIPILAKVGNSLALLFFLMRTGLFLRHLQPDIIQMDPGALTFQWVIKLLKPPNALLILDIRHINVGIRHDLPGKFKEWWQVKKLGNLVRLFDFTFFCHERTAQLVAGDDWRQTAVVVPVGIDARFYQYTPQPIDPTLTDPVQFIYVGGMTRFRELENILYAARQVAQTTTAFKVVLVGPDKANGYYHQLVEKLGLAHVVELRPAVPNEQIPALMAEFDVGIAYTPDRNTWDFQPTIKIIEYRALGLPILSFDVITHREWVVHETNGLLLTHSIESLAEGIMQYVTDRKFLQHCSANAQTMRKGLTVLDVCNKYVDTYTKLKHEAASSTVGRK